VQVYQNEEYKLYRLIGEFLEFFFEMTEVLDDIYIFNNPTL